jgi:hypothetical protein
MRRALFAAILIASPAAGADMLTGVEIRAAVSDKTVTGGMQASGPYTEFYGADGEIRGDGYTGAWTIEADSMCFDYGEGPDCWDVGMSEGEILWIKDGAVLGTGRAEAGNVNDF